MEKLFSGINFRYPFCCPRLIGGAIPPIPDRMPSILGCMKREIARASDQSKRLPRSVVSNSLKLSVCIRNRASTLAPHQTYIAH